MDMIVFAVSSIIYRTVSSINKKKRTFREESESEAALPMHLGLAQVFSYKELKKATNNFRSRVLGGGRFGKVYFGELRDGRMVAVKKLYDDSPKLLEQFFNEVTVLSRLHHQNLVALYGCTSPHSPELLLVFEFVPNGTVADHLHGPGQFLAWDVRIHIAIQTAEALTYLHSLEPTIIHRDVKTSNILLEALNMFLNNEQKQLVDPKLGYHSDCVIRKKIDSTAELARWCIHLQGNMRPQMGDVLRVLKEIREGTQYI